MAEWVGFVALESLRTEWVVVSHGPRKAVSLMSVFSTSDIFENGFGMIKELLLDGILFRQAPVSN
jgi:hypothetical protein